MRRALAAQGQSRMGAGLISLNLQSASGSRPLYNPQKDWSPRAAIAYSPHASSGLSHFLFGGEGKTSIRAGFGMFYDLFGQGVAREYDASELGFSSFLPSTVSPSNPLSTAATAPRFTGFYDLPHSTSRQRRKADSRRQYPSAFAVANSIDQALKSPYTMNIDFSIGCEFSHGLFIQGSYIGRFFAIRWRT
jgi:hypothetical protein